MPVANSNFVRNTLALLLVGLVTLLAIVAASLWLVGRTDTYADAVVDVQQIRRSAFGVINLVQDAETSQRGYLLTQEQPYLDPYRAAVANIDNEMVSLREHVQARPEYDAAVARLAELIEIKLAEIEETIALAQAGRVAEAIAIVRTDRGKVAMDAVRAAAADLIGRVDLRLAASSEGMQSSAGALTLVLAAGGALILLVVGGSTWIAWRHTRDLEQARTEVMELNATLEERVRERTGDVIRANEEIQRFAYIVSHDLRAPLVNIMGFTSELETGLSALRTFLEQVPANDDDVALQEARAAADADMPEAIGFIRSSTTRMDNLINAILKLSREGRRVLTPQRIDMARLLETAADSVRHQIAETGGEIEVVTPMPNPVSDQLALEQVFGNLLDNAVKYLDGTRSGRILIRGHETRTGIEYEVEDNGRGIAPEDHERIFELFRRSGAQDRPGEGIGLSHVRALVRRLGGDIDLQSQLGKGTTFRVRLPRHLPMLRESA